MYKQEFSGITIAAKLNTFSSSFKSMERYCVVTTSTRMISRFKTSD